MRWAARRLSGASYRASSRHPTESSLHRHETWGMKDPEVLMPIKCPECGEACLEGFSVAVVADALISGTRLRMRSRCHSKEWDASLVEMEQMRQYLCAGCIGPRNTGANSSIAWAPRRAAGSLTRPERPTYRRLARETAGFRSRGGGTVVNKIRAHETAPDAAAPAAKSLSALKLLWFFETVFLRRGR